MLKLYLDKKLPWVLSVVEVVDVRLWLGGGGGLYNLHSQDTGVLGVLSGPHRQGDTTDNKLDNWQQTNKSNKIKLSDRSQSKA